MLIYTIQSGKTVLDEGHSLRPRVSSRNFHLPVGRVETKEGLTLRVSLPAVWDEDLRFSAAMGELFLVGRRCEPEECEGSQAKQLALPYGNFHQRVRISRELDVSRLDGTFHHGVLDIHIPFLFQAVAVKVAVPQPRLTDAVGCPLAS